LRGRRDLMGWMKRQPTLQEELCRKGGRVPVNWPLPEEDVSSVGGGLKLTKKMFFLDLKRAEEEADEAVVASSSSVFVMISNQVALALLLDQVALALLLGGKKKSSAFSLPSSTITATASASTTNQKPPSSSNVASINTTGTPRQLYRRNIIACSTFKSSEPIFINW
jgi:hypothetical protein